MTELFDLPQSGSLQRPKNNGGRRAVLVRLACHHHGWVGAWFATE